MSTFHLYKTEISFGFHCRVKFTIQSTVVKQYVYLSIILLAIIYWSWSSY